MRFSGYESIKSEEAKDAEILIGVIDKDFLAGVFDSLGLSGPLVYVKEQSNTAD